MSTSLPLGSYVAADTPVHRLDARVKIVLLLCATICLFVSGSPLTLGAMTLALVVLLRLSRVPAGAVARALAPTGIILAFSLLANAFVLDGSADLLLLGNFGISWTGLSRGLVAVCRIVLLVGMSLVVAATTTSPQMADALVSLMRPLERVGVRVGDVAMTIGIALRFIPECAEEFDRIREAQRARGADFEAGSLVHRLSLWAGVLVPLIVSLFRRADVLADAMRDRCYRGEGRTSLSPALDGVDVVVLALGLLLTLVCCLVR